MTHTHPGTRRLSASGGLVLAFSLQICGCNPVPDCQRILQLQLSSLGSESLRERCAQCLSPRQMTSLVGDQGRLLLAGTVSAMRSEATIQQALAGDEGLSFYDPGSSADASADNASGSGPTFIQHAPTRRDSVSPEVLIAPSPIPESVFFLYRNVPSGLGAWRRVRIATAFVLSVPVLSVPVLGEPPGHLPSSTSGRTLVRFLVTARHIVDPEWAHCSIQNPASIEIRLNRRNGGVGFEKIPLQDAHMRHYFIPVDDTSDIALIPLDERLIPDLDSYKFVDTPFSLLPTESDLHTIAATQQVVTASLRTQVSEDLNDFPVSDSGVLSSTTNAPANIHCGSNSAARSLHVWFINASIQKGTSGAPVYTSLVRDGDTTPTAVLLGVQAIAWPERGLASITPSGALADLVQTALLDQKQDANPHRGAAP